MKSIKYIVAIILFSCSFTSYSQNKKSKKNSNKYTTLYCQKKNATTGKSTLEKLVVDKELLAILKEGKIKGMQYQLKDKGYDVDITGCLDKKTIKAWDENKINEKKAKKIAKKKRRNKHKK